MALGVGAGLAVRRRQARRSKELRIYNWSDYVDPEVLDAFTKETGIKVVYDTFDQMEMVETKLLAGKTGYDLVVVPRPSCRATSRRRSTRRSTRPRLPNLKNLWPEITERLGAIRSRQRVRRELHVGHDRHRLQCRQGQGAARPERPIDSWSIVLRIPRSSPSCRTAACTCSTRPRRCSRRRCAISASIRIRRTRPISSKAGECCCARSAPHIRKFHSSEYINALANGDICLAVGYSGDVLQARKRAEEAKNEVEIAYAIPKEGAQMWFDSFVIPKDAAQSRRRAHVHRLHEPARDGGEELQLHPVRQRQPRREAAALGGGARQSQHLSRRRR